MRRWQKTVVCPKCQTRNVLKARELTNGNIKFSADPKTIRCWSCGHDLRGVSLPHPFGNDEE